MLYWECILKNLILKSNGTIFPISSSKCMNVLVVKPDFGCSTKKIFLKKKKFNNSNFNYPTKKLSVFQNSIN